MLDSAIIEFAKFKRDKLLLGWDISDIIKVFTNKDCCKGELCRSAQHPNIPYRGSLSPKILFIGIAPGNTEDKVGQCFQGLSGKLMDGILADLDIDYNDVAFSNVVKCIPLTPNRSSIRDPTEDEIKICIHHLYNEIEFLQPKIIVTLGSIPLNSLIGSLSISNSRGRLYRRVIRDRTYSIIPTYHPAYILRGNPTAKNLLRNDILTAWKIIQGQNYDYKIIRDLFELDELVDTIIKLYKSNDLHAGLFACDLEWCGAHGDPFNANKEKCKISSINISYKPKFGRVLLWDHIESQFKDPISRSRIKTRLQYLMDNVPVGNHNIKIDYRMLNNRVGVTMRTIAFDTMLAHNHLVVDSEPSNLEYVAQKYCGIPPWKWKIDESLLSLPKDKHNFLHVPLHALEEYGSFDVDSVIQIVPLMRDELKLKDLYDSYMRLPNRAIIPIATMENNGQHVDMTVYNDIKIKYDKLQDEVLHELEKYDAVKNTIKKIGHFNPNAYTWLNELYYKQLSLPWISRTKTGFTTDGLARKILLTYTNSKGTAELDAISPECPINPVSDFESAYNIVKLTDEFKTYYSLRTKYIKPLYNFISDDGAIHATYKICSNATGRTATESPAVHTLPPRTILKDMFISRWITSGGIICKADESQIELRIMATLSGDKELTQAYIDGKDVHRYIACFTGNTRIKLLSGKSSSFEELYKEYKDKEFWVYSIDDNDNMVPGKAHSVRISGQVSELVEVTLDSGDIVRCTPDHLWRTRRGYVKAKDLYSGCSLSPLYHKHDRGYEMFYDLGDKKFEYTHKRVTDVTQSDKHFNGMIRHHIDFDKTNNSPDNLRCMTWSDHVILHKEHNPFKWYTQTKEHSECSSKNMKKLHNDPEFVKMLNKKRAINGRRLMLEYWKDPEFVKARIDDFKKAKIVYDKKLKEDPEFSTYVGEQISHGILNNKKEIERRRVHGRKNLGGNIVSHAKGVIRQYGRRIHELDKYNEQYWIDRASSINKQILLIMNNANISFNEVIIAYFGELYITYLAGVGISSDHVNHKIVSIKTIKLDTPVNVYDLTVDDYHNFALDLKDGSGVFVHNSRVFKTTEDAITYDQRRWSKTCFTGDTRISLLNGTEVPIKDLIGLEEFWVYSYDIENNKIVPGRAHDCRITKKDATLVKVTLDNEEEIKCTPDHRFLMSDGTYKEAQYLKSEDSLMPLYRKCKSCKEEIDTQDERVFAQLNHKVKLVEFLEERQDVYDFTVDKYHNFALTSGVFVHNCSFAILYGGGPPFLSLKTGLTITEAQKLIDDFFNAFPMIKIYSDANWEEVKRTGICRIPMGKIRPIKYANSMDDSKRAYAERQARNTPIQGSAALVVLDCLNNIYYDLDPRNLRSKMIAYTHDAVEFDTYPGELFRIMTMMKFHLMDNVNNTCPWIKVPIVCDFELGMNSGFMVKVKNFEFHTNNEGMIQLEGKESKVYQLVNALSVIYKCEYDFLPSKEEGEISSKVNLIKKVCYHDNYDLNSNIISIN